MYRKRKRDVERDGEDGDGERNPPPPRNEWGMACGESIRGAVVGVYCLHAHAHAYQHCHTTHAKHIIVITPIGMNARIHAHTYTHMHTHTRTGRRTGGYMYENGMAAFIGRRVLIPDWECD